MDDVAAAAGVGKGTLFRRFGSRAGLMMVLLDEDERASQQAFLFGPPPLGPDAPPLDRLIAFGRERMRFVHAHHQLLSEANRDPQTRHSAVDKVISRLLAGPALAFAQAKNAINAAALTELEPTFARELDGQEVLLRTHDFAEGAAAFLQRRTPNFTGS